MKLNRYFMLLFFAIIASGCRKEPEYSKMISACMEQSRKEFQSTGDIKFFENPLRKCLDEKFVNIKMPDLAFIDRNGDAIKISEIKTPVYIQTFSKRHGQCFRELKHLNTLAEKYKGEVTFILLVNFSDNTNTPCQSKAYRESFPDLCNPNPYNENIRVVYFEEDEVDHLKEGYGEIVYGVRNTGYPTCYYLNKDKTIFRITTIEDIMIESNKIYIENDTLSDDQLSKQSFENRVPEIFEEFAERNMR